ARVGVCLSRGVEMLIGVLGALKAGGAYVGLDPEYPAERLSYMLEDSEAKVVITERRLRERLSGYEGGGLGMEELREGGRGGRGEGMGGGARGENLAYVIYTSGSTGRPKGVGIEHRNAVKLLQWAGEEYGREVMRRVAATTSICFDLSVYEMFAP